MDHPCYHGSMSKQTGENLLLCKGKNGSYLLRDSESVPGAICLCILFGRFVYTYRIYQNIHGHYKVETSEGVKEKHFPTLKDLIVNYEKPDQGLAHHLVFPVNKDEAAKCHIYVEGPIKRILVEDIYAEVDAEEYVVVLPS